MRLSLPRLKMPRLPGFSILVWISTALKGWVMGSREKDTDSLIMYDRTLLWLTFGLAAIGFIMVTSASMPIGQRLTNDPFFFAKRDGVYLILAFILAIITLRLPMEFWQRHSTAMLIASIVMLLIVLVVGSSVNGASRWIALGPLRIQPAEFTKLSLFCYIANYLVRKGDEVRNNLRGFLKPMGVIFVLAILLLAQPDLGTVVVLFVTTLAMLFLGVPAVAVHCHYRYGHFSGCVADPRRTVPYPPCYRILEPVGRSLWQRLSVNAIADGVWSRRTLGARLR